MHFLEIDFRYDWVSITLDALEDGLTHIQEKGDAEPWFDGIWQLEHSENILGIAFVVAQSYILGAVDDLNKMRESEGKGPMNKINCYSDVPQRLPSKVSPILLINSIANYHKHHDEWDKWPTNLTGGTLISVGIGEGTEFPCHMAASMLWSEDGDLENLLTLISEWREYILLKYK